MNMRNVNIITVRSVPDKYVSDEFINAVISNCTTRMELPVRKKFSPESLPGDFNMAATGVMKKGVSINVFSSPGNAVCIGQPCAGKTKLLVELISDVMGIYKKGEGNEKVFFIYSSAGDVITFRLRRNKYGI